MKGDSFATFVAPVSIHSPEPVLVWLGHRWHRAAAARTAGRLRTACVSRGPAPAFPSRCRLFFCVG